MLLTSLHTSLCTFWDFDGYIVCMCSCLLGLFYVCCVCQLVNAKEKLTGKEMCLLSTAVTGLKDHILKPGGYHKMR